MSNDTIRYVAGVGVAICTTCMSALGLVLQKRGHRKHAGAAGEVDRLSTVLSRPTWIIGIALLVASSLLSLAVFSLVGQRCE